MSDDLKFPLLKKWLFLQAVFADSDLTNTAKIVAGRLLFHLNAKTGLCIPSYEKLAKGAGCSRRAAIEAIRQLETGSWISFDRRSNETVATSHSFRMHFEKITIDDDHSEEVSGEEFSPPSENPSPPSENPSPPIVKDLHHPWCRNFTTRGENSAPKHKEFEHNESERWNLTSPALGAGRSVAETKASFELFWAAYPEKVGKGAAEKSFAKIFKTGTVTLDLILAGLDRYKKSKPFDRAWCHPITFLNQQRWLDEPAPPSPQSPQRGLAPHISPRMARAIERGVLR